MIHLTSCLLVCLISTGNHVAARQTARSALPSEVWPPQVVWSGPSVEWLSPEALEGQNPRNPVQVHSPKSFNPDQLRSANAVKASDGSRYLQKKPQTYKSVVRPKTFSIQFQAPTDGHDHSQSSNYPTKRPQGASKPGFQLSLSLPIPTITTAPPSTTSGVNAGLSFSGSSQNKYFHNPFKLPEGNKPAELSPVAPTQQDKFFHNPFKVPKVNKPADFPLVTQKPPQSKLVSFLNQLLVQKTQQSSHGQSGSFSSPQSPNNFWMGHMGFAGSSDAGSGAQTPVHQAVQNTVHFPPQWHQINKPPFSDEDVKKDILQSVQYVNGKLMIPLEKCPGYEKLAATLKGHYHGHAHQHGQLHHDHVLQQGSPPHGHVHQHGQLHHDHVLQHGSPPHGHGHQHGSPPQGHQHGSPPHLHVHQHGSPPHGHIHQHGPSSPSDQMQTKPNYAQFYLNVQGTAPSPTELQEANVQLSGAYQENPFRRWQHSLAGGPQYRKPLQTYPSYVHKEPDKQQPGSNYVVLGANVEYDKQPDAQSPKKIPYGHQTRY